MMKRARVVWVKLGSSTICQTTASWDAKSPKPQRRRMSQCIVIQNINLFWFFKWKLKTSFWCFGENSICSAWKHIWKQPCLHLPVSDENQYLRKDMLSKFHHQYVCFSSLLIHIANYWPGVCTAALLLFPVVLLAFNTLPSKCETIWKQNSTLLRNNTTLSSSSSEKGLPWLVAFASVTYFLNPESRVASTSLCRELEKSFFHTGQFLAEKSLFLFW